METNEPKEDSDDDTDESNEDSSGTSGSDTDDEDDSAKKGWKGHVGHSDSEEDEDGEEDDEDTYLKTMYGEKEKSYVSATAEDDLFPKLYGSVVRWRSGKDLKIDASDLAASKIFGNDDDPEDQDGIGKSETEGEIQMLPANSSPYHWHEIRMKVDLPTVSIQSDAGAM